MSLYQLRTLYVAKRQGGDRFNYYTPAMQDAISKRMRLVNDLHKALAEDQFRVYYQPIVDLVTGAIYKAEALVRWQHPTHGLINPADFIPIAEETGLISDIGNWVSRQAVAQVMHCRANHHPEFQISINNSPVQFRIDPNHISSIIGHLKLLGLPGQCIVIEITESILMEAKDEISNQLLALRDNGIQVALDDFGTGYSSLSYLNKFDIDYIKIDQSFVRNLGSNSSDLILWEAIIVMAHKLGIKVIAEGVETQVQYDLLKQAGCDYGQGYLWSRPVPAEDFEKLLSKGWITASGTEL
jgi:EAL domain-containing protein (putative c-di-GMP-specific phosphodiesterase class I)